MLKSRSECSSPTFLTYKTSLEEAFNLSKAMLFTYELNELHWILPKVTFRFIALFQNNEKMRVQ